MGRNPQHFLAFSNTSPMRRLSASLRGAAAGGLKEFAVRREIAAQLQALEEKLSQCNSDRESRGLVTPGDRSQR